MSLLGSIRNSLHRWYPTLLEDLRGTWATFENCSSDSPWALVVCEVGEMWLMANGSEVPYICNICCPE